LHESFHGDCKKNAQTATTEQKLKVIRKRALENYSQSELWSCSERKEGNYSGVCGEKLSLVNLNFRRHQVL
jgi:hypothetical protein